MASICDSYCKGCIYAGVLGAETTWCKYVFMEDKLRGCPPGKGCTAKTTNQDLKRMAEQKRREQARKRKEEAQKRKELTAEQKQKRNEYMREFYIKRRAAVLRNCRHCGTEFHPCKGKLYFCCAECAREHYLITERERGRKKYAAKKKNKEEA